MTDKPALSLGDAAMERLIAALASCIVGCQGRTNADRAKAVLEVIREQGWRLVPPQEQI